MRSIGAASAVLLALAQDCAGHAYMSQPASRMRHRYDASPRTEFEPQSAGGGGGYAPCGKISGHDYTGDAWSSAQAQTHQTIIKGGVVQTEVTVTAHHWGHVEFSMCDLDTLNLAGKSDADRDALLWECFNKESNLLQRHPDYEVYDPSPIDANHPTRWYLPPRSMTSWPPQGWTGAPSKGGHPNEVGVYRMWMKVPETVNCDGDNCLLFFFYYTSNSCEAAGYRQYMSGNAPAAGVKTIIATSSDTVWTCGACGDCATVRLSEDGAIHNGKRAFDHDVSLAAPERFYGCADVSTTTGLAKASDLPPACSGAWCADQTCPCTQVSAAPTEVGQTNAPTKAPVTAAPQTKAPTKAPATAAPQTIAPTKAPTPTPPPTTATPTTEGLSCDQCTSGNYVTATKCGAECAGTYCHGSGALSCGTGLIFATAVGTCDYPQNHGCGTTLAPTTAAPTDASGTLQCSACFTSWHSVPVKCGALCAATYCHGNAGLACPSGLVFDADLSVCNFATAVQGCEAGAVRRHAAGLAAPRLRGSQK